MSEQVKSVFEQVKEYLRSNNLMANVDLVGSWIWIECNLRDNKEGRDFIKGLGFKFSSKKAKWYYHEGEYTKKGSKTYTYEQIKELNGSQKLI